MTQDTGGVWRIRPVDPCNKAVALSSLLVWLDRGFAGDGPRALLQRLGVTPEIVGTLGRNGLPGAALAAAYAELGLGPLA